MPFQVQGWASVRPLRRRDVLMQAEGLLRALLGTGARRSSAATSCASPSPAWPSMASAASTWPWPACGTFRRALCFTKAQTQPKPQATSSTGCVAPGAACMRDLWVCPVLVSYMLPCCMSGIGQDQGRRWFLTCRTLAILLARGGDSRRHAELPGYVIRGWGSSLASQTMICGHAWQGICHSS